MYRFILDNPLLASAICVETPPPALPDMTASFRELRDAGVGYVVVHNLILLNNPHCPQLKGYLHRAFSGVPVHFTDGEITVYKL
jgi:hypothetical protein